MTNEEAAGYLTYAKSVLINKKEMRRGSDFDDAFCIAIETLERTTWIPVNKQLPDADDDVLVYDGYDIFVAWYVRYDEKTIKDCRVNDCWYSNDSRYDRRTPIIAWMPLPEPYKCAKMEVAEESESCKGCPNICIMYDPDMEGCKDKMEV